MGGADIRRTRAPGPADARRPVLPARDVWHEPDPPGREADTADRITVPATPVAVLAERRREFLAFVERRVPDHEAAEDILQAAFVRAIDGIASLRDDRRVVAWFYRVLRRGLADRYRRNSAEQRALLRHAHAEPVTIEARGEASERAPCRCVLELVATLPGQYAGLLRRIDLEGASVNDVAREQGLSANNVRVRLHRARRALRQRVDAFCGACAEGRCGDCGCPPVSGSKRLRV